MRSTESLESRLLTLPQADRARLAELLLASLDQEGEEGSATKVEAAWVAEAERRLAELRSVTVAGVRAEQVFASLRSRYSE